MAALREIRDRINSIKSTMKITNAMYMISSTKINKAKKSLADNRPYFDASQTVLSKVLQNLPDEFEHPYLDDREFTDASHARRAIICVTADKGLAGSYNHNVIKMTETIMQGCEDPRLYVVGEVGRQYFMHRHVNIDEHFQYTAQDPSIPRARHIAGRMLDLFENGEVDEVYLVYTAMKAGAVYTSDVMQLLPLYRLNKEVVIAQQEKGKYEENFTLEPSPHDLLDIAVPDFLSGYIFSALVQSYCSEHYARMQAMDAANKNGQELIAQLSLQYNRVRQAKITQEITEVAAGEKARKQQLAKKKKKERSLAE